jgi:hypothetical protein
MILLLWALSPIFVACLMTAIWYLGAMVYRFLTYGDGPDG